MVDPVTDSESEFLEAPHALVSDLRELNEPGFEVPKRIDLAVHRYALQHIAARRRRRFVYRVVTAAAAATIAFAVILWHGSPDSQNPGAALTVLREDFDQNGRVDILDAFALARRLESASEIENRWDLTGDGIVDQRDVDVVSLVAVRVDGERG